MIEIRVNDLASSAARLTAMQLAAEQIAAEKPASGQLAAERPASVPVNRFAAILSAAAPPEQDIAAYFREAAQRYQVPEELLRAIGFHESRYQPEVVSSAGAMGIMQLMPATAKTMGVEDPFDPRQNILGGAKLLSQLFSQYDGDLKLTLAAYGAGSGSVAKYGGVPPFAETQGFVEDILSAVGEQSAPAQRPSPTYSGMLEAIASFTGFTEDDYRLFLAYLEKQREEAADTVLSLGRRL